MSRSGYVDGDDEDNRMNLYRGTVLSSIRGKRGQAFLKELLGCLEEMPVKELVAGALEAEGQVCAIGSVGRARGVDMSKLNPEDPEAVAAAFGISECMAREIVYENDEGADDSYTPEQRWRMMRNWAQSHITGWRPPFRYGDTVMYQDKEYTANYFDYREQTVNLQADGGPWLQGIPASEVTLVRSYVPAVKPKRATKNAEPTTLDLGGTT